MKVGDRVRFTWRYDPHPVLTGTLKCRDPWDGDLGYWVITLDEPIWRNVNGLMMYDEVVENEDNLEYV